MDDKIMTGLQAMTKDELIKFSLNAIDTIERLETSNEQFKSDLEAAGTVDTTIIWRWREWLDAMDKERDEWAVLATKTSEENKALKSENKKLIEKTGKVLEMLDMISRYANTEVDGNRPPSFLIGVITRIKKAISDGKSALIEFIVDEPIIENREQMQAPLQPALPPSTEVTEQPQSNA